MTPNGKYKAKCTQCGQVVAEFPILDIPIIGEPDARAKKVMTILGTHIMTKHGDQFAAGMHLIGDFQAFLIMSMFQTEDPSIQARAETVRAAIQRYTRKFTISDQQIQAAVVEIDSAGQLNAETVQKLFKEIRDVLTESGEHAPQLEKQQSPLIV